MKIEKLVQGLLVLGALSVGIAQAGPAAKGKAPAKAEAAEQAAGQQFDDWGYRCEKVQGAANESCNIIQVASQNPQAAGQGAQWLLQTAIGYLDGQERPAMVVKARLGVILPPGSVVTVPGHNPVRIPFQRCDNSGCVAFVFLDEPFVKALKDADAAAQKDENVRGSVALTYQATGAQGQVGQQTVALPLSLKGFSKAFAMLKPPAAAAAPAQAPAKGKGKK